MKAKKPKPTKDSLEVIEVKDDSSHLQENLANKHVPTSLGSKVHDKAREATSVFFFPLFYSLFVFSLCFVVCLHIYVYICSALDELHLWYPFILLILMIVHASPSNSEKLDTMFHLFFLVKIIEVYLQKALNVLINDLFNVAFTYFFLLTRYLYSCGWFSVSLNRQVSFWSNIWYSSCSLLVLRNHLVLGLLCSTLETSHKLLLPLLRL